MDVCGNSKRLHPKFPRRNEEGVTAEIMGWVRCWGAWMDMGQLFIGVYVHVVDMGV
jgi:hypothetical protein